MGAIVALVSAAFGFIGCFFLCKKEAIHTPIGEGATDNKTKEQFRTSSGLLSYKTKIPDEE